MYSIGSIAIARTSTDPLFVCHTVRVSVCLSVRRSSTKNRIMGYYTIYYKKRAEREAHIEKPQNNNFA